MESLKIDPGNVSSIKYEGVRDADLNTLNICVNQARGLMAKDRGGTSDPYYKVRKMMQ